MGVTETAEVPLTVENKRALKAWAEGYLGELVRGTVLCVAGLFVLIVFGSLYAWDWFVPFAKTKTTIVWIAVLSSVATLWLTRRMIRETYEYWRNDNELDDYGRDLANGIARRLRVDVTRYVEIEEFEDEGAGFLIELDDSRVLALVSQDLYEFTEDFEWEEFGEDRRDEFPQTRIEYLYAPLSGLPLDFCGIGETLKPIGKVRTAEHHFVKKPNKGESDFLAAEHGTFYDGSLEEVMERLQYTIKPQ